MSYMTIVQVDDDFDVVVTDNEFKNSHLFYTLTWKVLIEQYMRGGGVQWDDPCCPNYVPFLCFGDNMCERLWSGVADGSVPVRPEEYNVLVATYDRVLFRAEDVPLLSRSMELFTDLYPDRGGHWHDVSRALSGMSRAVGFEMSITDQWTSAGRYDDKTDEYIPYNVSDGKRHWWADLRDLATA